MEKIKVYDTTLRDGMQAEGVSFSLADKLLIAKRLDEFGVDYIEGGYPMSNPKEQQFFEEVTQKINDADAVLSLACGAGVQLLARIFPDKCVYPGVNTTFIGLVEEQGKWLESCLACGDCKLGKFGGVCPIARCSKSLLNGPCGGSADGTCEVDPENIDCAWQLIYDRLEKIGQLENLTEIEEPNDYSTAHDGRPRRLDRADMQL